MRCLELDGKEMAAALAGEAKRGRPVIHVATDGEVDAAAQEVASAGGVVVKPAAPTPLGRCGA
jgi:predicted enzyme related to lactoylglutathione lyase